MAAELEIQYSTAFQELERELEKIKRPGDYYATGSLETIMPGITVAGFGPLAFPVLAAQARELTAFAKRAPYGRGRETLLDESVRKVWQIEPAEVTVGGKGWGKTLDDLVWQIREDLGCGEAEVAPSFYKMLVYDEGGFFLPHRDSEKEEGMFATLVIVLPSAHTGGELHIRHAGRETLVDMSGGESQEIVYAAFYADCEHEVKPITSGYRVCLVYNLIQQKPAAKGKAKSTLKKLEPPDQRSLIGGVAALLQSWRENPESPDKLVYLLDHHYTEAGVSFAGLKNRDAALAQVFRAACAQSACALHLGIVHIEESGWAEYVGDGYSYRGRGKNEEQEEFEAGEVSDSLHYVNQWRNAKDEPVSLGEMPFVDEKELLPTGALEGEEPDKIHFSEASGNAGADFERTYLRAALVVWPEERYEKVVVSIGIEAGLARLEELTKTLAQAAGEEKESRLGVIRRLYHLLIEHWGSPLSHSGKDAHLSRLLENLKVIEDRSLLLHALNSVVMTHYSGAENAVLIGCLPLLDKKRAASWLTDFFLQFALAKTAAGMDLWTHLPSSVDRQDSLAYLDVMAEALPTCQPIMRVSRSYQERDEEFDWEHQLVEKSKDKEDQAPWMRPELLAGFLAKAIPFAPALGEKISRGLLGNSVMFPVPALLLPALKKLWETQYSREARAFQALLWVGMTRFYLARSAVPLAVPQDWVQDVPLKCNCELCQKLRVFMLSPAQTEERFRVNQGLRDHVIEQMKNQKLDISYSVDRKGSPHTLVCVKNRASYEKKLALYRLDVRDMKTLQKMAASLANLSELPAWGEKLDAALAASGM